MGIWKKVLEGILIIIVVVCFGKVGFKFWEYHKAESTYKDLAEEFKGEDTKASKEELRKKYNDLKDKNIDYYGWIKVEGTNIDYPVVKSKDNDEYLTTDFNGEKNASGSIFLDYRNSQYDFNKIIHGHHMRNGSMFHNLIKFKEKEFFNKNKKITLILKDEKVEYEIFSTYVTSAEDDYMVFGYDEDYISEIKAKSMHKIDKEITPDDEIITLSTCTYEFDDARMVVHGVKVK